MTTANRRTRTRRFLFGFALVLLESHAHAEIRQEPNPGGMNSIEITYLANEGFAISDGQRVVLIDALFGSGISGYPVVPSEIRQSIETATNGYERVVLTLATHVHGDHFDPEAVGRFLGHNQEALFVSTPQAIAALAGSDGHDRATRSRLREVLPAAGTSERLAFDGGVVEILELHHGPRTPPIENLGFVLDFGGLRVSHFGDTEAKAEDFEPYLDRLRNIDVALLPFWFLTSEWRREMVLQTLEPRAVLVAHLPEPNAPSSYFGRWNSYQQLLAIIASEFPSAIVPEASGQQWSFSVPEP